MEYLKIFDKKDKVPLPGSPWWILDCRHNIPNFSTPFPQLLGQNGWANSFWLPTLRKGASRFTLSMAPVSAIQIHRECTHQVRATVSAKIIPDALCSRCTYGVHKAVTFCTC